MTPIQRAATAAILASVVLAAAPAVAQTATPNEPRITAAATPVDYADGANWLCRPGRDDLCATIPPVTLVPVSGERQVQTPRPAVNAAFDCFYVYPTVSMDPGGNSDMIAGPEERAVIRAQFAPYAEVCRTFAPLYRQVTLTALGANLAGRPTPVDRELPYADVKAAWQRYLAEDNQGRGVILVGHSQGSGVLRRLIAEEIDGKPVQSRLISAHLIGTNIAVPEGKDVGGDFQSVPLCRSEGQTGCLVAWVTFRADEPRPAISLFGTMRGRPGMQAACANPAALGGGPATMDAILSPGAGLSGNIAPPAWPAGVAAPQTMFRAPGLVRGECVVRDGGSYLAVAERPGPGGQQPTRIGGEVLDAQGRPQPAWGLHVADMPVAMGDLIRLAGAQGRAWQAARPQR